MLRGSSALIEKRALVLQHALSGLAIDDRKQALKAMRQVLMSLDEELPVTETAVHGVGRCRGLHSLADKLQLLSDLLSSQGQHADAAAEIAAEITAHFEQELTVLQTGPSTLMRGAEEPIKQLKKRIAKFRHYFEPQQPLESDPTRIPPRGDRARIPPGAAAHVALLKSQMRTDAQKVLEFATQGVFLHHPVPLRPLAHADDLMPNGKFTTVWGRARSLLVAAEKVSQVMLLVKQGRRRSLQEAVQLLVKMEEDDIPQVR